MLEDDWTAFQGRMALQGCDIRRWDMPMLLAAYETALREGCKDESAWQRLYQALYAEPDAVRRQRRLGGIAASAGTGMSLGDAEALLASMTAADALYG